MSDYTATMIEHCRRAVDTGFTDEMIRHGREYTRHDLALVAVLPRGKKPYQPAWGKHPLRTEQQVERHWRSHPADNMGVALGFASNACDLEFDSPGGAELIERFVAAEELRTPTYASGKSLHRIYRLPANAHALGNILAVEGIELRLGADGQSQSVLPPSIHPSGRVYQWCEGLALGEVEILPCPLSIVEFIEERIAIRAEGQTVTTAERPAAIRLPDGDRPGDIFNATAGWSDVLEPFGWRVVGHKGDLTLWQHPLAESGGHSATTGWRTAAGNDVLTVFSNRTVFQTVLQGHKVYTRFEAFAALNCSGDLHEAARRLAQQGYRSANDRAPRTMSYMVP